jgi:RNA polymerase sigma-70 factor, ECF subfamily
MADALPRPQRCATALGTAPFAVGAVPMVVIVMAVGRFGFERHLHNVNAHGLVDMTAQAELLARARTGEREAFTALVERHHSELVRIAYAITGDLDEARDAAQLAWIKAWQQLTKVREPERLRAWLIAIAANEARQHLRAHRRRHVREITPLIQGEIPGHSVISSADRLDLAASLVRLDPADRGLLAMRYLAGLTAEEIGTATGRSASGVRTRLSRLIAQLREDLDRD